ncbi:hypothetical protein BD560DRAFT_444098 [Blakeslea trispora]|nr:hypothetical protein BD560DRAFT_444098 [Blakeslea trispora]
MAPQTTQQKNRSAVRRALRTEIESVREKVRAAYILETRRKEGEELTEEELEIIKERPVNMRVNEALEEMYLRRSSQSVEKNKTLQEEEIWSLMHFFYLVRLAQQGFFSLISTISPAIEPQALTYLADKMVGHSLHASRATDEQTRKSNKAQVRAIIRSLHDQTDEPVAEGFRTTYKQVMQLIHGLIDQSLGEQSRNKKAAASDKKEAEKKEEEEEEEQQTSREQEKEKPSSKQPPIATIPPIWVVMPYSSMMDGATFAMPGAVPSLPYPSTLLPTHILPRQAFPFMSPPEESKKRSNKKKNKKNKNNSSTATPVGEEEPVKKSKSPAEEPVKEEPSENPKEPIVDQTTKVEQDEQFENIDDDNDERFADPETSDDEVREDEEEEDEDDDGELTMDPNEHKPEEEEEETNEKNDWGEVSQDEVVAGSKWQSFAAASRENPEESNSRNNNTRHSPRKQNRSYNNKSKNNRY